MKDSSSSAVPFIGIGIAVTVYLVVVLFVAVDLEPGTRAEWFGAAAALVVGLVAVVFAALAYREAQQATLWARRAAEAETKSADISERDLASRVHFSATLSTFRPGIEAFSLGLEEGSPPVFVVNVDSSLHHPKASSEQLHEWEDGISTVFDSPDAEQGMWLHHGHAAIGFKATSGATDAENRKDVSLRFVVYYKVSEAAGARTFESPSVIVEIPTDVPTQYAMPVSSSDAWHRERRAQ